MIRSLNTSLAFFLQDLLSYMDRGFVFALIKLYTYEVSIQHRRYAFKYRLFQLFVLEFKITTSVYEIALISRSYLYLNELKLNTSFVCTKMFFVHCFLSTILS